MRIAMPRFIDSQEIRCRFTRNSKYGCTLREVGMRAGRVHCDRDSIYGDVFECRVTRVPRKMRITLRITNGHASKKNQRPHQASS